MPSVKKNFAWSSILTVAGYIFPLLTFPYVTRVLGVEGIGNYQYAVSVIHYFIVFACLGIDTIGIREIAKAKGNPEEMSRIYSSLLCLNLITTVLSVIVLLILIVFIPSFASHSKMLYIGVAWVFANSLVIEWLFKGLENFKYITIRAIIIRCIYVAAVFIFVRNPEDYVIYFILTTLITVVNALINQSYSRQFVRFSITNVDLKPFLSPFIILGIYKILTSMYTSFNVMFLGAVCGDSEVGLYSTSVKMYGIIMSFFTAFTGVMLPRMSAVVAEGKEKEFKRLTSKSIDFLLCFSLPIIVISEVYAPNIIRIIAGEGFAGSVLSMRIVMPLMLVIGYEQIIIIQMLFPLKKDKVILINSCVGAVVALLLDFILVPQFGNVGSAIVWCCSEITVLVSAQFFVSKYVGYQFPAKKIFVSVLVLAPSIAAVIFINNILDNWLVSMFVGSFFVLSYYVIVEYFLLKNIIVVEVVDRIKSRFLHDKVNC